MSKSTCPRCGQPASGNFCASCGAALAVAACPSCGAKPEPGSRFCTRCGTPLAGGASPPGGQGRRSSAPPPAGEGAAPASGDGGGESHMGWWAAGGLLVVLILVVAWPIISPEGRNAPPPASMGAGAAGGNPAAGQSAVDLTSMTPIEAADRLYNRVMGTLEAGDTASAVAFLPMSINAYEMARPLNVDGLFHLSTLQRMGGDLEGALATAEEALAQDGTHLLALFAAAEAASELGDQAQATAYYRQILDNWDAEMGGGKQDYQLHTNQMQDVRQTAVAAVGGG